MDVSARRTPTFGLGPAEIPLKAWDAIKRCFTQGDEISDTKDAVFLAARELWRFAVSTTIHAIWSKRLHRMEDPALPEVAHIVRAKTKFRRAITRFRGSTYQPDMQTDGHLFARVRCALADSLLCADEPPAKHKLPIASCLGVIYLLFFDGGSRGNPGPGGSGSVIVQLNIQVHAACNL